ncbi:hypothetical protein [Sphingomonas sanguinis]|uniref:hypothetical protein n=1 Tax=Sphingomonas sanguinis TaxID=33051 RepID=UPI003B967B67
MHYNLNRYYDPETGQYLSPDPIGVDGGLRTRAAQRRYRPPPRRRCYGRQRPRRESGACAPRTGRAHALPPCLIMFPTGQPAPDRPAAKSLTISTER